MERPSIRTSNQGDALLLAMPRLVELHNVGKVDRPAIVQDVLLSALRSTMQRIDNDESCKGSHSRSPSGLEHDRCPSSPSLGAIGQNFPMHPRHARTHLVNSRAHAV